MPKRLIDLGYKVTELPVQVVEMGKTTIYKDVTEVPETVLNSYYGPFYGRIDDKDALRYESREANHYLSMD